MSTTIFTEGNVDPGKVIEAAKEANKTVSINLENHLAKELAKFYRALLKEGIPDSLAHELTLRFYDKSTGSNMPKSNWRWK